VITTVMVFVMVAFAAIFFFVVDEAMNFGVRALLGFGG
jgi:preprotein translocase subunit SecE